MPPVESWDAKTWIALGSAVVAFASLFISAFTAFFAWRSRSVALGGAELALRSAITFTRQAVNRIGIDVASIRDGLRNDQLSAAEKRKLESYEKAFNEALEDNLNSYEEACAKYIDGKVDKTRFKKRPLLK